MTFRLCLLGNSHIAAYKRALTNLSSEIADTSITMFGVPGINFADLAVEDRRIVATSEAASALMLRTGGNDHIALEDYDALAIVGGSARFPEFANVLKRYQPPFANPLLAERVSDPGFKSELDAFYRKGNPDLVTAALFGELLDAVARRSNAACLLADAGRQSGIALGHVANPFPSATVLDAKPKQSVSRIVRLGLGPDFARCIWKALEASTPSGAVLVTPPEDVLIEGILTKHMYSEGSAALREEVGEHDDDDFIHMNDAYGEIMLRAVLDAIRQS